MQVLMTIFFTLEMLCKIGALGFQRYWSSWWHRFDMVVTTVTLPLVIVVYSPYKIKYLPGYNERVITYMWLIRFTRLSRCLRHVRRFDVLIRTLLLLLPSAGRLLRLLFCIFFLYSVLGMQIFGGLITTNPTDPNFAKLNSTAYGSSNYYANNFNDMYSGFVVLFELLVGNDWFVLADGFEAVTSVNARLYFASFYILGTLVSFNIIVASVLDTFNRENSRLQVHTVDTGVDGRQGASHSKYAAHTLGQDPRAAMSGHDDGAAAPSVWLQQVFEGTCDDPIAAKGAKDEWVYTEIDAQ
jgi:two pore calcium channel protein